jgi:hypothetical protein
VSSKGNTEHDLPATVLIGRINDCEVVRQVQKDLGELVLADLTVRRTVAGQSVLAPESVDDPVRVLALGHPTGALPRRHGTVVGADCGAPMFSRPNCSTV